MSSWDTSHSDYDTADLGFALEIPDLDLASKPLRIQGVDLDLIY